VAVAGLAVVAALALAALAEVLTAVSTGDLRRSTYAETTRRVDCDDLL